MKIPISHSAIKKLVSILEDCYRDQQQLDAELWSDFNLVEITHDLLDGDFHRDGMIIEITDDTANWLEAISADSPDTDMQLIAKSLQLDFSITMLD